MKKCVIVSMLCVVMWSAGFGMAPAADTGVRLGIGFQGTFPAFGLSLVADLDKSVSLQGIFGFVADLKSYSARLLYRFDTKSYYNFYGYGQVGIWSYSTAYAGLYVDNASETTFACGAGVGAEYNWQAMSRDLPPVWFNIELGFGYAKFSHVMYDVSLIDLGLGIHYRF